MKISDIKTQPNLVSKKMMLSSRGDAFPYSCDFHLIGDDIEIVPMDEKSSVLGVSAYEVDKFFGVTIEKVLFRTRVEAVAGGISVIYIARQRTE